MRVASVAWLQPGGIHVYRRQIIQCSKIVSHLRVITPQELVGCGSHVDVEGLALTALSVEELKYRLIQRRTFEVYPHNIEQSFAKIWRPALGGSIAPYVLVAGLVGHGINTRESNQSLLPLKAAHITDFCHELRTEGLSDTVHLHDRRVLRQHGRKALHFCAVGLHRT